MALGCRGWGRRRRCEDSWVRARRAASVDGLNRLAGTWRLDDGVAGLANQGRGEEGSPAHSARAADRFAEPGRVGLPFLQVIFVPPGGAERRTAPLEAGRPGARVAIGRPLRADSQSHPEGEGLGSCGRISASAHTLPSAQR